MATEVEAEVSLYPLGQERLAPLIEAFVRVLRDNRCEVEVRQMSSLVVGNSHNVFDALRSAYEQAASEGGCVLIVKVSNVCPVLVPGKGCSESSQRTGLADT